MEASSKSFAVVHTSLFTCISNKDSIHRRDASHLPREAKILQSLTHFFPNASATRTSSIDEVLGHHAGISHEAKIHATVHAFLSCVLATRATSNISSSYGAFPRMSFTPSSENIRYPCWVFMAACTWGFQQ
ncbi:UNVERIFIED_CONTAM: hypothetical protein Sradi_0177100 [Sesamum radiatum]|uniref:Uncharacterized protein n=1 Tax=Sesamum radiatum TaxID=300843 RepID=A0AAW2VZ59_SESRA